MKKYLAILACLFITKTNGQVIASRLDSLFDYCHSKFLFDGTVLIAEKGQIVFEKAYGDADTQSKIPITTDTKFRLGAISKQFTAFIILKLVDEGKLDLNKPAFAYLGHNEEKLARIDIK